MQKRINARRNWLLGLWAAEQMGLRGRDAELYARNFSHTLTEQTSEQTLICMLHDDLRSMGVELDNTAILQECNRLEQVVAGQILSQ